MTWIHSCAQSFFHFLYVSFFIFFFFFLFFTKKKIVRYLAVWKKDRVEWWIFVSKPLFIA